MESEPEYRPTKWKCPECGAKVTMYVQPSAPPTCANPTAHPKKIVQMTQAGKK